MMDDIFLYIPCIMTSSRSADFRNSSDVRDIGWKHNVFLVTLIIDMPIIPNWGNMTDFTFVHLVQQIKIYNGRIIVCFLNIYPTRRFHFIARCSWFLVNLISFMLQ